MGEATGDVLVTLVMREFTGADGRLVYVSALNEFSCLSVPADLPEVVSVPPVACLPTAPGSVVRATFRGHQGVQSWVRTCDGRWKTSDTGGLSYTDADLDLVEVPWTPEEVQ